MFFFQPYLIIFNISDSSVIVCREFSFRKLQKVKDNYTFLPRRHKEMLPNFQDHVKTIKQCIEENQNFLFKIVSHTNKMFENRDNTRIPAVSVNKGCLFIVH